jgi:hypothetical protein
MVETGFFKYPSKTLKCKIRTFFNEKTPFFTSLTWFHSAQLNITIMVPQYDYFSPPTNN